MPLSTLVRLPPLWLLRLPLAPYIRCEVLPAQPVVGSSGLEPPTSRLSGVRSNHLSYEPISVAVRGLAMSRPTCVFSSVFGFFVAFPLAFDLLNSRCGTLSARNASGAAGGGDEQNRTVDPLLARQVLSQLSYTPMSHTGLPLFGRVVLSHRFSRFL